MLESVVLLKSCDVMKTDNRGRDVLGSLTFSELEGRLTSIESTMSYMTESNLSNDVVEEVLNALKKDKMRVLKAMVDKVTKLCEVNNVVFTD